MKGEEKMKTKQKPAFSTTSLLVIGGLLVSLLSLAACGNTAQSGSNAATQASSAGVSAANIPTAVGTEEVFPTFTPGGRGNVFQARPLANASPEEIGQVAINYTIARGQSFGGKPQVLLVRPTTWKEIADMGLGMRGSSTIEEPPLMLVILKGDFSGGGLPDFNKSTTFNQNTIGQGAAYVAYVFDLWAGVPAYTFTSLHGEGLKQALNDPSLPDMQPVSQVPVGTDPHIVAVPTAPAHLHYGDTAPGLPASGQSVREASFGVWRYVAQRGVSDETTPEGAAVAPDQVYAEIAIDGSVTAQYLTANRQLLDQAAAGSGQYEIWVAFNKYLPVDQFRALVQAHGMKTGVSYLRAIDQNPKPVYAPYYPLNVVANGADAIPQSDLESKFASLSNDPQKQISLKGVYLTHAWVDAKQLAAIATDPNVYYVDMTANAVRADQAKAGVAGAAQAVVVPHPELIFNSMVEAPMENK